MSGETEAPIPGAGSARSLLEAMRDAAVTAPHPPTPTRVTIKGAPEVVESMLPGIREAFFPKDALVIGEGRFHTVSWNLDRPMAHGMEPGPWSLTVELIEART